MKKKIALLLTVAMVTMTMLAGCGSTSENPAGEGSDAGSTANKVSGETVTVSEMLEHVLADNGGTMYIIAKGTAEQYTLEALENNEDVSFAITYVTAYDGSKLETHKSENSFYFWNDDNKKHTYDSFVSSIYERVDNEASNVSLSLSTYGDNDLPEEVLKGESINSDADVYFYETMYHVTDGKGNSFMVFYNNNGGYNKYTLIKDTDWSKDKTVVLDTDL